MGNTSSEHVDNIERHRILGEVHIHVKSDTEGGLQEFMTVRKVLNSESDFNTWRKHVRRIDDGRASDVLLLPVEMVYESEGICGSSGIGEVSSHLRPTEKTHVGGIIFVVPARKRVDIAYQLCHHPQHATRLQGRP